MADNESLAWDLHQGVKWINNACELLRNQGKGRFEELARAAYGAALPSLRKGVHISPIHHVGRVTELLVRIVLGETDVEDNFLAQAIVAVIFHDTGNRGEPPGEHKITAEEVRKDPSKLNATEEQRRRHMLLSGRLVQNFLQTYKAWTFTEKEQETIKRVVEHHDDPSIAELRTSADRPSLLFKNGKCLVAIHREADRLWMLTREGLVTDLKRKADKGKPWNAQAQVTHNVIRHLEERQLYEEVFGSEIDGLGFQPLTAFYRTQEGQRLFQELQQELRIVLAKDWQDLVTSKLELREGAEPDGCSRPRRNDDSPG